MILRFLFNSQMNERVKKPDWLKVSFRANDAYSQTKQIVDTHHLHTICSSGRCPNIGECWGRGTATFMIAGEICTRACKFCNTQTGKPLPLNPNEPTEVAQSISLMKLKHAVVTSVDRDDLSDYGAAHWATTIRTIKQINPTVTLEVLIPDFRGNSELLQVVLAESPEVVSHNIETVRRLTPSVRSVATYDTSLKVIAEIASAKTNIVPKSGLMVGLGETDQEVIETIEDLRAVGCRVLTIGQYLQPSRKNIPVTKYIHPDQFSAYKEKALKIGFSEVESAPLVRSSYFAEKHFKG